MKKLLCLIPVLLSFVLIHAQFKTLAEGPVFEDFGKENCRILQLKNGNTLFFEFTAKDGLVVRPYDSKHTEGEVVHIEKLLFGKYDRSTSIEALFEMDGDVAIFISELQGKVPTLYRIIIDGKNGKLKEDKLIASIDKISFTDGYALTFGDVPMPGFYVKKDPGSNNYAVVYMRSFEEDRNKRIEVFHYGTGHHLISQAFVNSPGDAYKYLFYNDILVMGKDKVCLLVFAKNTKASGGKSSELLFVNLNAGDKETTSTALDFTKRFEAVQGQIKYNPVTQKLIFLLTGSDSVKTGKSVPYIAYFDPATKKVNHYDEVYPTDAKSKALELYGAGYGAIGFPQDIYFRQDGGFNIIFENRFIASTDPSSGRGISWPVRRNISVGCYDSTGKSLSSYYIPCEHSMDDQQNHSPLAHKDYDRFKTSFYIDTKEKPYIILNDLFENDAPKGKFVRQVDAPFECDAFWFDISGKEVMPRRKFLFGLPEDKEHNLAIVSVSDYNPETNVYTTLRYSKERKHKGVYLVWLQPS
jgi:hypothetical protein